MRKKFRYAFDFYLPILISPGRKYFSQTWSVFSLSCFLKLASFSRYFVITLRYSFRQLLLFVSPAMVVGTLSLNDSACFILQLVPH